MERASDAEKHPFLNDESYDSVRIDEHQFETSQKSHNLRRRCIVSLLTAITIISLLFNVFLVLHQPTSLGGNISRPFSPADPFTTYELKSINSRDPDDIFVGPPGSVFDHAWSDLLTAGFMRVTPEELREAGRQSLRIQDSEGENYLGYLEVYHQLHCVKRMVQNRWPKRYPKLQAMGMFTDGHFNHCIQVLRKGIMCNGDTSLNTFKWSAENSTQFSGISSAPRRCINWDSMDAWARSRATGVHVELIPEGEEGWLGPN